MNTIACFILGKRRFHTLLVLGLAVLFGVTATTQAGSGISVSVSATDISASAMVGGVKAMLLRVGGRPG
jgi:hypothetical protein